VRAAALALALALALAPALGFVAAPAAADDDAPGARNAILFIGDGTGLSQIALGRLVKGAPLAVDAFPTTGLALTSSADFAITDSAAAATAMACGVKGRNNRIGLDRDGKPVPSIAADLRGAGYAVGLVTTTRVTHATPACFYAHHPDREREDDIAAQLVESEAVDLVLGGGRRHFPAERLERLRARGFEVALDLEALGRAKGPRLVGLFAGSHLPYEIDRDREREPSLAALTAAAVALLEAHVDAGRAKGYFLVVEGGRVDHACHQHDAPTAARDVVAFDRAVGETRARVGARGDTLVVVTADHATGGLAISELVDVEGLRAARASVERTLAAQSPGRSPSDLDVARVAHEAAARLGVHFLPVEAQAKHLSTEGHDGTAVPVYAAGPGAERFGGTFENTEIPSKIRAALAVPAGAAARGRRF